MSSQNGTNRQQLHTFSFLEKLSSLHSEGKINNMPTWEYKQKVNYRSEKEKIKKLRKQQRKEEKKPCFN
jgi:hypothetical protein